MLKLNDDKLFIFTLSAKLKTKLRNTEPKLDTDQTMLMLPHVNSYLQLLSLSTEKHQLYPYAH